MTNYRIRRAAHHLWSGGVIAYPTEAVWGLGCDPLDPEAFDHILELKRRPVEKGVILIAASAGQLRPYLGDLSAEEMKRLRSPRPVPTTWVVPASPHAPEWITGGRRTLAARITGHPLAAALCRVFGGPIVSTSANPQAKPPARTALKVRCYFPAGEVHVVPGPLGGVARPSEIRDLRSGEILRPGG